VHGLPPHRMHADAGLIDSGSWTHRSAAEGRLHQVDIRSYEYPTARINFSCHARLRDSLTHLLRALVQQRSDADVQGVRAAAPGTGISKHDAVTTPDGKFQSPNRTLSPIKRGSPD
jgi:hypothetical protein